MNLDYLCNVKQGLLTLSCRAGTPSNFTLLLMTRPALPWASVMQIIAFAIFCLYHGKLTLLHEKGLLHAMYTHAHICDDSYNHINGKI